MFARVGSGFTPDGSQFAPSGKGLGRVGTRLAPEKNGLDASGEIYKIIFVPLKPKTIHLEPSKFIMNQDQINITGMHSTVAGYFDQNTAIWSGNKAVSDAVAQLKANNDVIAQKRDVQETATDGQSELARQAKHDLEAKILEIADQLYALAAKTNDVALEAQSHFTLSLLDGLDPDKLEQTGKDVGALATAKLAALADYGITAADVTALGTLTTNFGKVKNVFRTAVSKRAGQTTTLPQAIAANQSLLRKQLDKLMTKFKAGNPDFYAGYQAARVIVDRRSHHKAKTPPTPPRSG